ncbi:MAG: DUF6786 family protein [Bacteroidia bacterium]
MKPLHCISRYLPLMIICMIFTTSCTSSDKKTLSENSYEPGTYGFDADFLKKHQQVVELSDGNSFVLISPEYQGRVMTSSAAGRSGNSFGWLNYDLISSGKQEAHIHAFGGEDRFWLGPEGGQFSVYFAPGKSFEFANWFVPPAIDSEPFPLISSSSTEALFERDIHLLNHSGNTFDLAVSRKIKLLSSESVGEIIGITPDQGVDFVGFESETQITNRGTNAWTPETGALSIWILGMLKPSPSTTIAIPYRTGTIEERGPVVNDAYFGEIPGERLLVADSVLFLKADGKFRSKIGLSPHRNTPFAGSYDAAGHVLTIVRYSVHEGTDTYVNSMWALQDHPFAGDVINAYNDGPLEDGGQLGPFYELETSSPAAFLKPGESMSHIHTTFHFTGNEASLSLISQKVLGVTTEEIARALPQ